MVVATLICSTSIVTAQTVEPSQTLTEIVKKKDCTVFTFNYPSVSAAGEETVLSSALFAWTPSDRQEAGGIESLHIYSHITVTADKERLPDYEGYGVTKDKPHPYLSQRVTAPTTWWLPCATILRTTARVTAWRPHTVRERPPCPS